MQLTDDGLFRLVTAIVKSAPRKERIEYAWLAEVLIPDPIRPTARRRASKDVTDLWTPQEGQRRYSTRPDRRGQSIRVSERQEA
jgi:hypothetical protein